MYSNRNDKSDTWGDEWYKKFEKQKESEYDGVAIKYGYDNYLESYGDSFEMDSDIRTVQNKYNPVCNKTKDGRTYLYGESWGVGRSEKHTSKKPKLSEDEIISAIAKQVTKIKIKL